MKTFKATAASISARWGQIDRNLAKVIAAAEQAADDNARLLLLPECCLTGADWPTGETQPAVDQVALTLDSPAMAEVARAARRTGVIIAVGLYEKKGRAVHVSQALVGPKGLIGVYRKVHEGARSSRDRQLFPVFDLGFARVGVSICYDNMFPECGRVLVLNGSEVLLAPFTSLPLTRNSWRLQRLLPLRARAQDNRLFVLSASHPLGHVAGRPAEWGYSGICCAIDPLGEVIAESTGAVGRPQRVTVTVDERVARTYFLADVPSMRARRPGAYRALASGQTQLEWLDAAPAFRYNVRSDRLTVPAKTRRPPRPER